MAFRVVRLRKERRRNAKLDEMFSERDNNQNGKISLAQLADIYRIYEVEFDEAAAAKITDENGEISKPDFMKFGTDTKLLDFDAGGHGVKKTSEPKRKPTTQTKTSTGKGSGPGLFCCCEGDKPEVSPSHDPAMDKIATAFKKFDKDGDGFIDWEEFQAIAKNMEPEQAQRIFQSCNKAGNGKISLEEFRSMAERKPAVDQ